MTISRLKQQETARIRGCLMLQFNTEDKQTTHAPSDRDNGANIEGDTRAMMAGDCETIIRNMFV